MDYKFWGLMLTIATVYSGFLLGIIKWLLDKYTKEQEKQLTSLSKSTENLNKKLSGLESSLPKDYTLGKSCEGTQKKINNKLKEVKEEANESIKALKEETNTNLKDLREKTNAEIRELREHINSNIASIDAKFDEIVRVMFDKFDVFRKDFFNEQVKIFKEVFKNVHSE